MKYKKNIVIVALLIAAILLVGSALFSITGSETENIANPLTGTHDVYFNLVQSTSVGDYAIASPIKQVYSADVTVEYKGMIANTGSRYDIKLTTQDGTVLGGTQYYVYTNDPIRAISLSPEVLTAELKGKDTLKLYARLSTIYSSDVAADIIPSMKVEVHDLNINYDAIECNMADTEDMNAQVCDDSNYLTKDICYDYECQHVPYDIIDPPKPEPSGLSALITDLIDWIKQIFNQFFFMSIFGDSEVMPGETKQYVIDISAAEPDHLYQDGDYQTQYAYWALVDSSGNIRTGQTEGVEVNGTYATVATVIIPQAFDNYILMATIEQIDSTYSFDTGTWTHGEAYVVVKEALDLTAAAPEIIKPAPSGLALFLTQLLDWFKDLFSWIM